MKLVYTMSVKANEKAQIKTPITPITIENINILWIINNDNLLNNIKLEVANIDLRIDENGYISAAPYIDIENKVYKVALFIANQFFIQTGLDIIRYDSIFNSSPDIIPETEEETDIYNKTPKLGHSDTHGEFYVTVPFNPDKYAKSYDVSDAIANYTEGLRMLNVLKKYEQFYKVIEHFFKSRGKQLDKQVSRYMKKIDKSYTEEKIHRFRDLRNRCIHPKMKNHINPEDISAVKDVNSELASIKKLAELLIRNPRKKKL